MFIPSVRNIFSLTELNQTQWGIVAGISMLPLVIMELQKKLNEVLFGKTVYGTFRDSSKTFHEV